MTNLYYIHDPMCSWCWAFNPTWEKILEGLPKQLSLKYLLGGLAPDSDEPMPIPMQHQIAGYWHTIEQEVPGTRFNFDFWKSCSPKRSTYLACRAVIACKNQRAFLEQAFIHAIQRAYYLEARNPSNSETLIQIAESLNLDANKFAEDLNSPQTQKQLEDEIYFAIKIGSQGFPSLILEKNNTFRSIPIDYNNPDYVLSQINS